MGTSSVISEEAHDDGSPHYLYVVECADGTWYTGYTTDVEKRIAAHNGTAGAKYTRSRRPVTLVAQARFETKHDALSAEYRFKRLSRSQKELLVEQAEAEPFETVLARWLTSLQNPSDAAPHTGRLPRSSRG